MSKKTLIPLHDPTDGDKVAELVASMSRDGWQGPPLVCDGDQLLTGAHRYVAARAVGIEIPTIEIRDVFTAAGLDFDEIHEAAGCPTIDQWSDWEWILHHLPRQVREEYGIDLG